MNVAIGVVLGIGVAVIFLGSTPLLLRPLVNASTAFSPLSALLFFAVKAVAATVVLALLFDVGGVADHVDLAAFGTSAAVASILWTGWQLRRFRRDRTPTYDLGENEQ